MWPIAFSNKHNMASKRASYLVMHIKAKPKELDVNLIITAGHLHPQNEWWKNYKKSSTSSSMRDLLHLSSSYTKHLYVVLCKSSTRNMFQEVAKYKRGMHLLQKRMQIIATRALWWRDINRPRGRCTTILRCIWTRRSWFRQFRNRKRGVCHRSMWQLRLSQYGCVSMPKLAMRPVLSWR